MSGQRRFLATGGSESLCLWNVDNGYEKEYCYCPSSSLSSQVWTKDGACLGSVPKDSPGVLMTYLNKSGFMTSELALSKGPAKAISFAKTSLWVSHGKSISRYPLKRPDKLPDKEFTLNGIGSHETVSALALNVRDDYAAVGTSKGVLKVINLYSGQETPLSESDQSALNQVRYNNVRHSLLGSASDSGTVSFYDVNQGRRCQTFKRHSGPATGIAFSPVNELLVLSSGLDKRCVCYDTKEKKAVCTIKTEFPLTCVDFQQEGFILALGTSRGRVLIYDLRSYETPINNFEAHGTYVHCIRYSNAFPSSKKGTAKPSIINKDISKENILPATPPSTALASNAKEVENSLKDDSLGSTQAFSPLRRDFTSSPLDRSSLGRNCLGALSSNNNTSTESFFSPLREGTSSSNTTMASSFDKGNSLFSPLSCIKEEMFPPRKSSMSRSSSRKELLASKTKAIREIATKTASLIKEDLKPLTLPPSNLIKENKTKDSAGDIEDVEDNVFFNEKCSVRNLATAFPEAVFTSTLEHSEVGEDSDTFRDPLRFPSEASSAANPQNNFQQTYFQGMIKDVIDDYALDIRKQLWSMRYEIIHSFYEQNDLLNKEIIDSSPNLRLIEENRRLREEIETLKGFY